ncbi:hypothetical protein J6590_052983 [Homalodisca vitripennis]|nr:hypothetical protein J6590_052983 [Homalodisca vitripennis]
MVEERARFLSYPVAVNVNSKEVPGKYYTNFISLPKRFYLQWLVKQTGATLFEFSGKERIDDRTSVRDGRIWTRLCLLLSRLYLSEVVLKKQESRDFCELGFCFSIYLHQRQRLLSP